MKFPQGEAMQLASGYDTSNYRARIIYCLKSNAYENSPQPAATKNQKV
jgi:hypothetical protein